MFERNNVKELYMSEINRKFDKSGVAFLDAQAEYNGFYYDE